MEIDSAIRMMSGRIDDFASSLTLFERLDAVLQQRLESQPDSENLLFQLAACKRKQGKLTEALECYAGLCQRYPSNSQYRFVLDALRGGLEGCLPEEVCLPHSSPLVIWDGFLPPSTIQETLDYLCQNQAAFRPAGLMGKDENPRYDKNIRNNTDLSLKNHPLKKMVRELIMPQVSDLCHCLGLETFEVDHIEVQLRAYHRGEYFRTHHDAAKGRRINFVYFFYPTPKRYSGGELVIFDTDTKHMTLNQEFTRIIPTNNRIVFFPSQYFHAVLPAKPQDDDFLSGRFVINGHICSAGT